MTREQPRTARCRLAVVTGKGGVGKSTVSAALALALARQGRDTVAAELSGQARLPGLLGHPSAGRPGTELEVSPGLWTTTIDPESALVEWAGRLVRPRAVLEVAVRSRAFSGFVSAAPGAAELISVAKAAELSQPDRWLDEAPRHDTLVLDAPASGHGLGLLRTPNTYAEIARVGPVAGQAREVDTLLRDPERCLILVVCAPEETPVNETIELSEALERDLGRKPSLVVMNGMVEAELSDREAQAARASLAGSPALAAAEARSALAARQGDQLERLRSLSPAPVLVLPDAGPVGVTPETVEELADRLAGALDAG